MTKAELVALITHQTGVEKTAAEAVVEAFMRNIKAVSYTHLTLPTT